MTHALDLTRHNANVSHQLPNAAGAALRKFREERGLTGREFANATGVSQGHVSELETGRRRLTPALTQRIAAAMAMSPEDFLSRISALTDSYTLAETSPRTTYNLREPLEMPAIHDDFRSLAEWLLDSIPKDDAWEMVRKLTTEAQAGDIKAARRAKALIEILSNRSIG